MCSKKDIELLKNEEVSIILIYKRKMQHYALYSIIDSGNLELRHSVLHFPPKIRYNKGQVAELNTALCLVSKARN